MSDEREQVEQAANRIRSELFVTLSELDRRRDRALDPRYQLQKHAPLLIGVAAAIAGLAAVAAAWAVHRRHNKQERMRAERWQGIRRAWSHPERLASKAKQRPAPVEVGRKVATSFAMALGAQLAKRAALKLVPGPASPPRGTAASMG